MAREDVTVLKEIDGYKVKKGREEGSIFFMAPRGECFSIPYKTLKNILLEIESDQELKERLGI